MIGHYILRDGQPVEVDLMTWAHWFETAMGERIVEQTHVSESVFVSTVFLGIDHRFGFSGAPILYETMIFGGDYDERQWRYSTLDEAKAGHARAVAMIEAPPDVGVR